MKLAEVSVNVDLFLQCPSKVAAESSLSLNFLSIPAELCLNGKSNNKSILVS